MDPVIASTLEGYLSGFDQVSIAPGPIADEVNAFKQELTGYAENCSDVMQFISGFTSEGYQERYTAVITKAYMANQLASAMNNGAAPSEEGTVSGEGAASRSDAQVGGCVLPETGDAASAAALSVHDFLAQYRSSFDAVRSDGTRPNGEAAYRNLFDVENRADDMLDAQIIIEKERLLWRIVADDGIDIMRNTLAKMDPLQKETVIASQIQLEAFENSDSDEELSYLIASRDTEKYQVMASAETRMAIAAVLADYLVKYCKAKSEVFAWRSDTLAQSGIAAMVTLREAIRRTLGLMGHDFGLDFDDLLSDEGASVWMLSPQNMDECGRRKKVLDPYDFQVYKDVIDNEIVPDIGITDILLRKDVPAFHFAKA